MTETIDKGKGFGFKRDNGKLAMIRCFDCGKENYAMNILSGYCTWCGYNANQPSDDKP